jgi:DNA-binding MarR family transcriptional regulator
MPRSRETSDEEILIEFYLHDDPALVAKEAADVLGMSRQGLHERLKELESRGMLHSKKPGRDRIYWLTDDGQHAARTALRD